MSQTPPHTEELFAQTARIVSYLEGVRRTANEITLSAANAKAVAARAGSKAAGFIPITNFVDEMGRETRHLVERVNRDAQLTVREALAELYLRDSLERLQRGCAGLAEPGAHLTAISRNMTTDLKAASDRTNRQLVQLREVLSQINDHARTASMMSTRARVEATVAEEYQHSLESVADTVEAAATRIREVVLRCRSMLDAANDERSRRGLAHATN